jgi:hypothetical protein
LGRGYQITSLERLLQEQKMTLQVSDVALRSAKRGEFRASRLHNHPNLESHWGNVDCCRTLDSRVTLITQDDFDDDPSAWAFLYEAEAVEDPEGLTQ